MYRIFIDSTIKACAIKFAKTVLNANAYKVNLEHFKNNLTCQDKKFEQKAKQYVQLVIDSYKKNGVKLSGLSLSDSIISAVSSSFNSYICQFEKIIPRNKLSKLVKYTNQNGTCFDDLFWKVLVRILDYGSFKTDYYECIEDIGIFTCVYCNMAPADKSDANFSNYQMEHFYPKNLFPYLSTSFFNFFPSCGTCNQNKGKKFDDKGFDLYRMLKSDCANPFKFTTRNAICYYRKYKGKKEVFEKSINVKVFFNSPTKYAEKQIKKLRIEEKYNCTRVRRKLYDILFKYERYTKTQINVTKRTFPKLKALDVNNVYDVFGDYSKEEEVYKDQLVKLSIDFGKETGMI